MADLKIHWSFWLIGALALIWNAMGCANFIMQMNPATLASYPEEAKALVASRPQWATIAFAIAVFGGALGALLLLIKNSFALFVFDASLIGVVITNIHTFTETSSESIWAGSIASFVIALFLIWYTSLAKRKDWIK